MSIFLPLSHQSHNVCTKSGAAHLVISHRPGAWYAPLLGLSGFRHCTHRVPSEPDAGSLLCFENPITSALTHAQNLGNDQNSLVLHPSASRDRTAEDGPGRQNSWRPQSPNLQQNDDAVRPSQVLRIPANGREEYKAPILHDDRTEASRTVDTRPYGSRAPFASTPVESHNASTGNGKPRKYCMKWIRTGECEYMQQGCRNKHEIPHPCCNRR